MLRRNFLRMVSALVVGYGIEGMPQSLGESRRPRRGVSLAGAEFGSERADFSNESPGTVGRDYTYNTERTVAYFCRAGLCLLRIPVRWERLQPRLRNELESVELERLKLVIGWARQHGGEVIIDIHNYGRYVLTHDGHRRECVMDARELGKPMVRREDFADLWSRLAREFREEPAVYAYGLMNEPHDMGTASWQEISQSAVRAIRGQGDRKLILVAGNGWSSAEHFAEHNGRRAWITDPARNVAYEAHCYFDADSSGHYALTYEEELALDRRLESRGAQRVRPFIEWCRANRVRGFLGEFGIPVADAGWQRVLKGFLDEVDRAGMESCYWAAGEWWGAYPLSIQPGEGERATAVMRILKP